MLKHHADPNIKNGGGFAPLHASASNDSAVITELLIQHGADVNVKDKCNRTPLTWVAMEGKKESVKVLLRNGADVNVVDKGRNHVGGATPFDHAWENGYAEICKLLR